MTTLYGKFVPFYLIIDKTRTVEVNEKHQDRTESEYCHHCTLDKECRLMTKQEIEREEKE